MRIGSSRHGLQWRAEKEATFVASFLTALPAGFYVTAPAWPELSAAQSQSNLESANLVVGIFFGVYRVARVLFHKISVLGSIDSLQG